MTDKDNQLEKQPYLVIEELDPQFRCSLNKGSLTEPLLRTRRRWIMRVHVIQFSAFGCYVGKNFGRNPHYMIPHEHYEKSIVKRCELFDIPLTFYPKSKTISYTDLLVCFNFDSNTSKETTTQLCPETRKVYDILISMNLESLGTTGCTFGDNVSESTLHGTVVEQDVVRGARQQHMGFSSNYSLARLPKEQGGMVSPRILDGSLSPDSVSKFVEMTRLGDAVYSHSCAKKIRQDGGASKKLYDNERRNKRFAKLIHEDNRIEAITYSETDDGGALLKIHVDTNNDDTMSGQSGNYNYVICVWFFVQMPDGTWKRIAILAYSRRSVGDLFVREDLCRHFFDKTMTPWLKALPEWRKQIIPDRSIFEKKFYGSRVEVGEKGELYFPPTINKHVSYLSGYVDAIIRLNRGYEKVNKKKMSVEKQLEAILPIVFCNCALPYVSVIDHILEDSERIQDLDRNNLTVLFMKNLQELFSSIRSSGGGKTRHQPTFNKDPSDLWIFESLLILRQAVLECRSNPRFSFQCLMQKLKDIKGIGDLLGQHLAHVMALSFVIPARFGAGAVVCSGTATAQRLSRIHGIKKSSFKCLMEYTCLEYEWMPYLSECGLCKVVQDPNVRFRDAIYPTQESVYWITITDEEEYRVMRLDRNGSTSCGLVTCSRTLNHRMEEVTQHNSDSISNMKTILANWWIPRRKIEFRAILARYADPKPDTHTGRSIGTSRKRRRTRDMDTCLPVANKKIDWRNLDDREMREFSDDFAEKMKTAAFQLHKRRRDELYGNQDSSRCNSLDLRLIHNMGKLFCSRRTARYPQKRSSFPGLFKSVTHLLSLGVMDFPIEDLSQFTQKVTRQRYLEDNPNHVGGVMLQLELIALISNKNTRQISVNGGRLYGVCAHLMSGHSRNNETLIPLKTWLLGEGGERCLAVKSHQGMYPLRSEQNNAVTLSSAGILGFIAKKDAKRAMLWYLIMLNEHVSWIDTEVPVDLWRSTLNKESASTQSTIYVMVSIGGNRGGNGKGEVLCVIGRQLEGGSRKSFVKMVATEKIFSIALGPSQNNTRFLGENESCDMGIGVFTPDTQHKKMPGTPTSDSKTVFTTNSKRRKRCAVLAIPTEIDPFMGKSGTSRENMEVLITKWQNVWSFVLDEWRTSVIVRPSGSSMDRYWHPPDTSTEGGSIRSPRDLQSFLNYCSETIVAQGNASDRPDFSRFLREWTTR